MKFKSQLNLTNIFAKYAYWQASPVEPELGTAQPQLVINISCEIYGFPAGNARAPAGENTILMFCTKLYIMKVNYIYS